VYDNDRREQGEYLIEKLAGELAVNVFTIGAHDRSSRVCQGDNGN